MTSARLRHVTVIFFLFFLQQAIFSFLCYTLATFEKKLYEIKQASKQTNKQNTQPNNKTHTKLRKTERKTTEGRRKQKQKVA